LIFTKAPLHILISNQKKFTSSLAPSE